MKYHVPVLLNESIEGLNIHPKGIYVDATFGGGGHSAAILAKLNGGHLFGFDQDSDAKQNGFDSEQFTFVHHNFAYVKNFIQYFGVGDVDAPCGCCSCQDCRVCQGSLLAIHHREDRA